MIRRSERVGRVHLYSLAKLGVNDATDYAALIPTDVAYLRREGFLRQVN